MSPIRTLPEAQTSSLGRANTALGPADSMMDHVDPGRSRLRVIISSGSLAFEAIVFLRTATSRHCGC